MDHIKTYPVSSFLQKGIKVIMIDKSVKSTGYRSVPLTVNLTQTCFKTPTPLSPSWKWSHFQGKTFSIFTVSLHQDPRPAWDVLGLGEEAGVFLRRSPADTGKARKLCTEEPNCCATLALVGVRLTQKNCLQTSETPCMKTQIQGKIKKINICQLDFQLK